MKKLIFLAAAVVLVTAILMVALPADTAQADPGPTQYCKWLAESYPWLFDLFYKNHGDCVSDLTYRNDWAPQTCKYLQEYWPWYFDAYWKNLGDCVSDFRH